MFSCEVLFKLLYFVCVMIRFVRLIMLSNTFFVELFLVSLTNERATQLVVSGG